MINHRLSAKKFFYSLNKNSMNLVDDFYHPEIVFYDPIVTIKGIKQIRQYYKNLYNHVISIYWQIPHEISEDNQTALAWQMHLTAQNFNGNKPVVVDGASIIKFDSKDGRAIYHRDYFDMGAFVYEGIPVLGSLVRFVKAKMANHKDE